MAPPVNRKKAKRRQKQATRIVTEQQSVNGTSSTDLPDQLHMSKDHSDFDDGELYEHDDIDDEEEENMAPLTNGDDSTHNIKSKKKKKSKARSSSKSLIDESPTSPSTPSASINRPQPPPPPIAKSHMMNKGSKDRIWNTSTQEERENIKKFWLELGEDERRALVKVEKDAVLKKMKEQQKHSCSCTVCGRKRTAIEEELEVLYDAYYEELEQYANTNQGAFHNGAIVPPPRLIHHNIHPLDHRHTHIHHHHHPSHGRVHELPEDEDDLEDDYDEDDDEEPYSDDELEDEESRSERADFFAFGNSLTVKDGILTVADDLLKNDGKHFIDMMEQLAERRMQREEDTQYGMAAAHQSLHAGHNHGPLDDEDYEDEEEDEEAYGSQDEEEYEDDDMDTMTEEQRMEEGRRMFQIFAARMFEQRVLTAYREKVAQQRQELLLKELMEEETLNEQRNAKKAREAQKKKDKKKQQKQAREEERARREAEKAAEEAAARALEEQKLEEQRRKKEELRKKKEAEKKALEEERLRKEAEKQKRLQEERERQAEAERKQREQKERERRKREEAKKKEREEREAKEKELREKKAKQERDRRVRDDQVKREADFATKPDQAAKERTLPQSSSQTVMTGPKRLSQSGPGMIPMPPGLQYPQGAPAANSPHFQVATPIVPKASTPARPRQPSQQGSHASSPRSQAASGTEPLTSISPQTVPLSQSSGTPTSSSGKLGLSQQPVLHHPQPSAPLSPLGSVGRSHPLSYPIINGLPSHPPPGMTGLATRPIGNENMPLYPPHSGPVGSQYRGFPAPNGVLLPPGIATGRSMPGPGRGYPMDVGHNLAFSGQPPVPGVFSTAQPVGRPHGHSRQASSSFDRPPLEGQPLNAPISRPTPIKRPSSPPKAEGKPTHSDIDDLSAQLGSSALLDDSDVPFTTNLSQSMPGPQVPSGFGLSRASFGASPLFPDPLSPPKQPSFSGPGGAWGAQGPFGVPFATSWGAGTGGAWPTRAFGTGNNHRTHTSRPVAVRLLVIQAIKSLNTMSPSKLAPGFHDVNRLLQQVEQLKPSNEPSISLNEMLDICDTEGSPQNGGGSFIVKEDESLNRYVKFEPDNNSPLTSHRGSYVPGDIGSPVPGSTLPATLGGIGTIPGVRQFSPPTSF